MLKKTGMVYFAEGEPYDTDELSLDGAGKPLSLWSAIALFYEEDPAAWARMAKDCFGLVGDDVHLLMAEAVMDRVRETNALPVFAALDGEQFFEVFIDPRGKHRLRVAHDARRAP